MPEQAVQTMADRIQRELADEGPSVLLYGSVTLGDFRPGWSDIDLLVLCERPIPPETASRLVGLRGRMAEETGDAVYRLFEGGMLSREGFLAGQREQAVYWGTSGERLREGYSLDSFAIAGLLRHGRLLAGNDLRDRLAYPSHDRFRSDISRHLATVREHGSCGGLYACGWLLDIARGLYTLRTDEIIAKTAAGEWALAEGIVPEPEVMLRALAIRRDPGRFKRLPEERAFCAALDPSIQRFADVLEAALARDS